MSHEYIAISQQQLTVFPGEEIHISIKALDELGKKSGAIVRVRDVSH